MNPVVKIEKVANGYIVEYTRKRKAPVGFEGFQSFQYTEEKAIYRSLEEVITFLKVHFEGGDVA